jgi:tRNA nucleotidyltransferase (CCA-adding enzyme)
MKIGKQSLSKYGPRLRYSNHPYVEAHIKGIRVNVVPCYNVEKGKWKSAADRSPYHTEYIRANLDDEKKNQVRLLKKFLKSIGVYGAEIAINGFSGYVTEILILKYGSFESVLKALSNIREDKNIISIGKFDEDILKIFQSPLIIIDPIDSRRNLGTAISAESVGKAILGARAFLEKPSLDFFRKTAERYYNKNSKKIYSNLLIIEFIYRQRSPDIIWGQIKRSLNAISKQLYIANFTVIRSIGDIDEKGHATLVFLLEAITLPPYMARTGPHIFRSKDTNSFISENIKRSLLMWVNNKMRVESLVERKTINAKEYLKFILNKKDIGITKGLREDMQGTLQIYTGDEKEMDGLVKNAVYKLITSDSRIFR